MEYEDIEVVEEEIRKRPRTTVEQNKVARPIVPKKISSDSGLECLDLSQKGLRRCKDVSVFYRILESRCACIYDYLLKTTRKESIFSTMMILPVLLSFTGSDFQESVISQEYDTFSQGMDIPDTYVFEQQTLGRKLLECNMAWNRSLPEYQKIKQRINLNYVFLNPVYTETVRSIMFLHQILGVIDKPSFVEESPYYVNIDGKTDKVLRINEQWDELCGSKPIGECEDESKKCLLRETSKGGKACINAQRFRKLKIGSKGSYYILEDPYTNKKILYRPLCLYHIISGNAGIFEQHDIVSGKPIKNNKYTITFPPFGGDTKASMKGFMAYYWGGYIVDVHAGFKNVGIQTGLWTRINSWYEHCFQQLNIPKNSDIYIVGVSLGGALTILAAFKLLLAGYTNIHMYSLGAPRVGDTSFKNFMNKANLAPDSACYTRINNVIRNKTFYTQFDPVTKFPSNTWSFWWPSGYSLRFSDNPRLRGMASGLTFNLVLNTFSTQPEYDMLPFDQARRLWVTSPNKATPIGGDCSNHWGFVHSMGAYSANNFVGARDYEGNPVYSNFFDAVRNLDVEKCEQDKSEGSV